VDSVKRLLKRWLDVVLAGAALIAASPVMAAVAVLILVRDGRPVLFRQMRPGYKGKPFTLLKFRTMTNARDERGALLADSERVTPLGKWLRQLSLDELPQLWNVLRGDMSLVGPRPLLMQYLSRYSPEQSRRHDVKPGMTGWAQIHGRNAVSWQERFALDVWYVVNWSLRLDVWILARTIWQTVARDGVCQPGHASMPEFLGNLGNRTRPS
jgi:sugar transferase EpsL